MQRRTDTDGGYGPPHRVQLDHGLPPGRAIVWMVWGPDDQGRVADSLRNGIAWASDFSGVTVAALADNAQLGLSVKMIRSHLGALSRDGLLQSFKVYRRAIDGLYRHSPAYRLMIPQDRADEFEVKPWKD